MSAMSEFAGESESSERTARRRQSREPKITIRTWLWFFGLDRVVAIVAGWLAT